MTCVNCNGSGTIEQDRGGHSDKLCSICQGTGQVEMEAK